MAFSPPPQQNATDQSLNFFWLLAIFIGAFGLVWWLWPQVIIVPVFKFRIWETHFSFFLGDVWNDIANLFHLPTVSTHNLGVVQDYMQGAIKAYNKAEFDGVSLNQFAQVNYIVGGWVKWPAALILLAMAVALHFRHGVARYRRIFSMKTLKNTEVENWPQIRPVLTLDLVKEDIEKGPWAMAKMPIDFGKEHDLVHIEKKENKNIWIVDRGPAQRVFAMQLGPMWKEPQALPIHLKALLVIFVARAEKKREIANKLLTQIAQSASSGKLNFSHVEHYLAQLQHCRVIHWLAARHSYVATLMMSLLDIARTDGVLATAEFLWLKPLDRRMWYTLNTVGRQTSVVEVSGIFSHWRAEKKVGKALKTPMVKEAVNGLEVAIKEILYKSEGESWRSKEA